MLGSPYVTRLLGGTLMGRLPNGMASVAIVLRTLAAGRGIALGGLFSTLYELASALSQPVKGHMMDRYGQARCTCRPQPSTPAFWSLCRSPRPTADRHSPRPSSSPPDRPLPRRKPGCGHCGRVP
ncbi:hypothetical protein OIC43_09485 [Streptomyces sp. NBC_00825]|uniref:hypothetical protein n=1 Tax=unclassified Streptomyces TaxID=2593676 RepID=UPI002ED42EEB|nr:hypothetical protein OG832_34210 [Streptomyces sp. NBC_00826]WTH89254.1 hypothetical protein OIC43_09485 [Streptomyces sp. NBC_00825]WTH97979.1 hypothetical protein OHA23_09470 [Streptomyces sp. NBC_00822]